MLCTHQILQKLDFLINYIPFSYPATSLIPPLPTESPLIFRFSTKAAAHFAQDTSSSTKSGQNRPKYWKIIGREKDLQTDRRAKFLLCCRMQTKILRVKTKRFSIRPLKLFFKSTPKVINMFLPEEIWKFSSIFQYLAGFGNQVHREMKTPPAAVLSAAQPHFVFINGNNIITHLFSLWQ